MALADEVGVHRRALCKTLVLFLHGKNLAGRGVESRVADTALKETDLGALVNATIFIGHEVLGNFVLLDMSIGVPAPIPILLLSFIVQGSNEGLHLVRKMSDMVYAKVVIE
jgi:hypothetical protein